MYPEKIVIQKDTCFPVLNAALITIAKTWKQPEHPSVNEWIKMWCVYTYHGILLSVLIFQYTQQKFRISINYLWNQRDIRGWLLRTNFAIHDTNGSFEWCHCILAFRKQPQWLLAHLLHDYHFLDYFCEMKSPLIQHLSKNIDQILSQLRK